MKLTRQPTGGHYINELNVVLNTSPNQGKGDSLGRTARSMMVYDEDSLDLLNGVLSFFEGNAVYRYPGWAEYNSRDHAIIAISCLKQMYGGTSSNMTCRAYKTHPRYTLGQRIWLNALFSKFWSILYLIYKLPGLAVIYPAWNWFWRFISGTLETWDSTVAMYLINRYEPPTKWQKFCAKLTLPVYASFYTLYEINALESQFAKRILQKVMILHFEKSNYVARAMCGQKVSYPEGYLPSRKNRWSIRLDKTCDRDMTPYNDTEENNLELGMLKYYTK